MISESFKQTLASFAHYAHEQGASDEEIDALTLDLVHSVVSAASPGLLLQVPQ